MLVNSNRENQNVGECWCEPESVCSICSIYDNIYKTLVLCFHSKQRFTKVFSTSFNIKRLIIRIMHKTFKKQLLIEHYVLELKNQHSL